MKNTVNIVSQLVLKVYLKTNLHWMALLIWKLYLSNCKNNVTAA